jgi:hypothetical protein
MKMNIIKSTLLMGLALGCMPIAAQGTSAPYSPGITQDAVSYWLPKTKLTVTVTTRKSTFKPGEFSRYAERYLRMNNVKDKAEEIWEITSVDITPSGIPDKERLYTLSFSAKGKRPYFELTDQGILAAVNTQAQKEPTSSAAKPAPAQPAVKKVNPQDYMTEEILMAGSSAKMAELVAKEIYNIRESRNAITRGQADFVPTDGESLKFMLESLNEQESALLTLFSGTADTEEHTFTIDVTPDAPVTKLLLFRFSSKLGVLPVDNLAGEPVWIDIADKKMFDGYQAPAGNGKTVKSSAQFLYYRIPGRATINVYNNRLSFTEQDVQIAQFGNVEVISSTIMGRNADTRIVFDTTTGNVKSINE